ncbi:MAG: PEP-CTERM sorting domain-containing protein [Rhodocyclaceae bacterium]|nr:PEP-CTERM sorting domain-containing protein [Rhodocyclaceae bacterium]
MARSILIALAAFGAATTALAETKFYDGFDAPAGTALDGYNGYVITSQPTLESGDSKVAEIRAPGLQAPAEPSVGNAAYLDYWTRSGAKVWYTANKDIPDFGATSGTGVATFYVSALFRSTELPAGAGAWLKVGIPIDFASGADRYFSIGIKQEDRLGVLQPQVFAEGLGSTYGDWYLADYTPGTTVQVVARFSFQKMALTDQFRFEVRAMANPLPGVEPDWSMQTLITAESNKVGTYVVPSLSLSLARGGSNRGAGGLIDEVRIGTAYEDVVPEVPEPEAWAMLAAGLGILGALRRRHC